MTIHLSPGMAKAACLYAGVAFGLYWIPIRALNESGFSSLSAGIALNAIPFAVIAPILIYRWRHIFRNGIHFHLGALLLGFAYALYVSAYAYTQIFNVILLFYLLPVWGFLLAWLVIGEALSSIRLLSLLLGMIGIGFVVGGSGPVGLFESIGDIMALASGILWAVGSLLLLLDRQGTATDCGFVFIAWSTLFLAGFSLIGGASEFAGPSLVDAAYEVLYWLVPVGLLLILPASLATVIGPTILNPGVVGLLFMTEISVGTVSAWLLSNEPVGLHQLIAIVFITGAGILEPLLSFRRKARA